MAPPPHPQQKTKVFPRYEKFGKQIMFHICSGYDKIGKLIFPTFPGYETMETLVFSNMSRMLGIMEPSISNLSRITHRYDIITHRFANISRFTNR